MIRAWAVCAVAMLLFGCQSREKPVRGARQSVDRPPGSAPAAEPPKLPVPTPEPPESSEPERIVVGTTRVETEQRDMGAELNAAVGVPMSCVRDFVASRPTTIRISVSAIVRPTGMCIEPTANGAGLSAAALNCIRERIGTVVLKPLDDPEKSETVSTVIEIEYEPPVVVESDPAVPEPSLKNVKAPLPKRPEVAPSGKPIQAPTSKPIEGGTAKDPDGPRGVPISGPKPRAIDGYEVDQNAQQWR
jgi:hypothetical protein